MVAPRLSRSLVVAVVGLLTCAVAGSASPSTSSFFTGPAGRGIILPPAKQRVLLGVAQTGTAASVARQVRSLEASLGRKLHIEHLFMQHTCSLQLGPIAAVVRRGHIPMISWLPTPGNGGAILRGDADACIRSVGRQIARQPHRLFLRPYWEFNGYWFAHSRDVDDSLLTPDEHKAMWRRTVDRLREAGAFPRTSVVWCPHEGHFGNGDAFDEGIAYPGDEYVDWVCSTEYNSGSNWCGYHFGWCSYEQVMTHGGKSPGVEQVFRGSKPYMAGETGCLEDPYTDGRKGRWFRDARDYIKGKATGTNAFVYFDMPFKGDNWRIATSRSSLAGFAALARSTYPPFRPGLRPPSNRFAEQPTYHQSP
jgi:hypothetical protein